MKIQLLFAIVLLFAATPLLAQNMDGMAGMDHSHMEHMSEPQTFLPGHFASGTSLEPRSSPEWMIHKNFGKWKMMFHGQLFATESVETGPQGKNKFYSTNWFMIEASRALKGGEITLGYMPSLEPFTITDRQYPLFFQTGETAFGRPIMNGQHPHDGTMAVYVRYTHNLDSHTTAIVYCAPEGDPALGSIAFPHSVTASGFPEARISHHWNDGSHDAFSVCTIGVSQKRWMAETSMFHGHEPDEHRWTITPGKELGVPDSWSARFTYSPNDNWLMQVSHGHITAPEAPLEPGDVDRTTASVIYNKPLTHSTSSGQADGNWATTLIWGMNHERATHENSHAFVLETNWQFRRRYSISGRIENVEKRGLLLTNDLTARPTAFTFSFTRKMFLNKYSQGDLGFDTSFYALSKELQSVYGSNPVGIRIFFRMRLGSQMHMNH